MAERDMVWCTQSGEASTFRLLYLSFVFVAFNHYNLVLHCCLSTLFTVYSWNSQNLLKFSEAHLFVRPVLVCKKDTVTVSHPFANNSCSSNGTQLWTRL